MKHGEEVNMMLIRGRVLIRDRGGRLFDGGRLCKGGCLLDKSGDIKKVALTLEWYLSEKGFYSGSALNQCRVHIQ